MSKKPPKKPSRRKEPAPRLCDVMGDIHFPRVGVVVAAVMRLGSPSLMKAIEDYEKWAASARKFIAAYESGRLTED